MKVKNKKISLSEGDLSRIADLLHGTLDTRFANVSTKKDLEKLATKEDLQALKIELKQYTHEGVETIMAELDRIEEKLAEKEEVEKLKIWATKVSQKVGVTYK